MSHGIALRLSQAAIGVNTKHSLAAREPEKSWAAVVEPTKSWVAVDNWVHFSGLTSVERTYLRLS